MTRQTRLPCGTRRRALIAVWRCGLGVSALALSQASHAQQVPPQPDGKRAVLAPSTPGRQINVLPPSGFEDLSAPVHTLFDLSFQGRSIGAFDATYNNGQLSFTEPEKVAAALGADVDTAKVLAFLSKALAGNEQFRCRPGQSPNVGCGILPGGASGVIVTAESFGVELFLGREYLTVVETGPRLLGPPTSGPSLIQGVRVSAATTGNSGLRYGGTFDTLASVGRTSFIAQSALTDQDGLRIQQAYAQQIWSDRRAAVGILQDFNSATFASYRILGGEFGSFFGTYIDSENDTATPIEVVLPKRAQVEIYRDTVLIATGQYEAGLQLIDTHNFPAGSYSVRVVARDGGAVLLDQRRTFTKLAGLAPPGKTAFRFRAGERVRDSFVTSDLTGQNQPFFPSTTGELILSGSAQRRLGRSFAGGLTLTSVDKRVFSEAMLQVFRGRVSGLVAVGGGANGAYSGVISGSVQFPVVSFFLSARSTHANETVDLTQSNDRYRPFFRSEDTVFGSVQTRLLGGSASLSGSYTRSPTLPDRYAIGVQYTRSMRLPLTGAALLTASATASDFDKRVGISVSFFRQIDRKTEASFTAGGQYVRDSDLGGRSGVSPIAEAVVTRTERFGSVDATGQVGGSTDADSDRVFGQVRAQSPLGSADATAQYQTRSTGNSNTSFLFNAQTGFVFGGGGFKFGLRNPADAMVLIDLAAAKAARRTNLAAGADGRPAAEAKPYGPRDERDIAEGGYRITVNSRPYDYVKPGNVIAVGLPALKPYSVGLKPEGAPQFDLDATTRPVTLYPGNVVRLRFQARRVVTIFGQIVDATGAPLPGARIEAASDYAIADDHGYFTITGPDSAVMVAKTADGTRCFERKLVSVVGNGQRSVLYRVGKLACEAGPATTIGADQPANVPIAHASEVSDVNQSIRGLLSKARTEILALD